MAQNEFYLPMRSVADIFFKMLHMLYIVLSHPLSKPLLQFRVTIAIVGWCSG